MIRIWKKSHSMARKGLRGLTAAILATPLLLNSAVADLSPNMEQFLDWEFNYNSFNRPGKRGAQHFEMENFLIPLSAIEYDADQLPEQMKRELIVQGKDGEKMVRWIINPEDTKYYLQLKKWLKKKGLSTDTEKGHFKGHLTASRSIVIETPSGHTFSGKVSTNWTGGAWRDKKVNTTQGKKARLSTNFASKILNNVGNEVHHIKFLPEPAAFMIPEIEQSMIVRDLRGLGKGTKYFMPAFAALNPKSGKSVALAYARHMGEKVTDENNYTRIFWYNHLIKPMAHAFAEFSVYFGLSYESAHSQQFAVEMKMVNGTLIPTGKMIFRDFNDAFALKEYPHPNDLIKDWKNYYRRGPLQVRFGLLNAIYRAQEDSKNGGWIDAEQRQKWSNLFFQEFENKYEELSGIQKKEMNIRTRKSGGTKTYVTKSYWLKSARWVSFVNNFGECFQDKNKKVMATFNKQSYKLDCEQALGNVPDHFNEMAAALQIPLDVKKQKSLRIIDRAKLFKERF